MAISFVQSVNVVTTTVSGCSGELCIATYDGFVSRLPRSGGYVRHMGKHGPWCLILGSKEPRQGCFTVEYSGVVPRSAVKKTLGHVGIKGFRIKGL